MRFKFRTSLLTDVGTRKQVNQDAALVKTARAADGRGIVLAVLCDGLGGLSKGEAASAAFVKRMREWFRTELPQALTGETPTRRLDTEEEADVLMDAVERQWRLIAEEMNGRIASYGEKHACRLGTTALCLLLVENEYIVMHIGDTRLYAADETALTQKTRDHSLVQQRLERGEITEEEARTCDYQNVLLQCVGATDFIAPEVKRGNLVGAISFLLCTDGFWRRQEKERMHDAVRPSACHDEEEMKNHLQGCIEAVRQQGETDNITALLVACLTESRHA